MNVLVIGSGGREHALAWKIAQSPRTDQVYVAPGNAGTAADVLNAELDVNDFEAVIAFAKKRDIRILRMTSQGQVEYGFDYTAFVRGDAPESNLLLEPGDTIIVPD